MPPWGMLTRWMLAVALVAFGHRALHAQRVAIPAPTPPSLSSTVNPPPPTGMSNGGPMVPYGGLSTPGSLGAPTYSPPALGGGGFDPYAMPSGGPNAPSFGAPGYNAPGYNAPGYNAPGYNAPGYGGPGFNSGNFGGGGGMLPSIPGYGLNASNPLAPPESQYSTNTYPMSSPPALFPNGILGPGAGMGGFNGGYGTGSPFFDAITSPITAVPGAFRFFQGPRFRHNWVMGGDSEEALGINDTDASLAFAWPNFFGTLQPLYIVPSFSSHLWDGPVSGAADLPSKAYSAFLDSAWSSDPNRIWGAEVGVRVGVFTDYETMSTDSIRVRGQGFGRLRITPTTTAKLGVMYVDRDNIKLIPAGGLLFQPNPYTRLDLFFPEPKFARYWSTIGRQDLWWFLTGRYGGGSWTIQRAAGTSDSIDINDIRVLMGLEWGPNDWLRSGRRLGFIEAGVVFNREILYRFNPADDVDLDPAFTISAGFGY
jgi:hypothetical protein